MQGDDNQVHLFMGNAAGINIPPIKALVANCILTSAEHVQYSVGSLKMAPLFWQIRAENLNVSMCHIPTGLWG